METKQTQPKRLLFNLMIIILLGGLLCLYVGWFYWVVQFGDGDPGRMSFAGTFGDSFGVLNALFSGIALIAIAISIMQAQKQIAIQQEELKQNTAELKAQREEMETQNRYLHRQSVQNQFFQMVGAWQDLLEQLSVHRRQTFTGRAAVQTLYNDYVHAINRRRSTSGSDRKTADDDVDANWNKVAIAMNPYFELLNQIHIHILTSVNLEDTQVTSYGNITRSLLSHLEQEIIFQFLFRNQDHPLNKTVRRFNLLYHYDVPDTAVDEYKFLMKLKADK